MERVCVAAVGVWAGVVNESLKKWSTVREHVYTPVTLTSTGWQVDRGHIVPAAAMHTRGQSAERCIDAAPSPLHMCASMRCAPLTRAPPHWY